MKITIRKSLFTLTYATLSTDLFIYQLGSQSTVLRRVRIRRTSKMNMHLCLISRHFRIDFPRKVASHLPCHPHLFVCAPPQLFTPSAFCELSLCIRSHCKSCISPNSIFSRCIQQIRLHRHSVRAFYAIVMSAFMFGQYFWVTWFYHLLFMCQASFLYLRPSKKRVWAKNLPKPFFCTETCF